ncbi:artemin isoform X2 [Mus pahari]|uniref:artemin isoform X2 n=1 Tax=Mus pahari TaxID=10093 RepID=UPI000A305941|nr:artemin isoform X2 [Mus pahari]
MELGLAEPTALSHCLRPRWQSAWWPTLAALALLSCVTEASLDPMSLSPAARDGPSPVLAPPTDHLPGRWTHCAFVQRKSPTTPAAVSSARTPAARSRAPVSSRRAPRSTRGACRNPEQPRTDHRCARLPPALAAGAGERARPGPQLRRADTFPLLQRLVPPSTIPARSQPGQPAGRRGPAVASRVPADQPALLPAHSL